MECSKQLSGREADAAEYLLSFSPKRRRNLIIVREDIVDSIVWRTESLLSME